MKINNSSNCPAKHLNALFLNTENKEAPNMPKYVTVNRNSYETSDEESSTDDETSTDEDQISTDDEISTEEENSSDNGDYFNLVIFKNNIPKWGFYIEHDNNNIYVDNNCSIDYQLLGFYVLKKIKKDNIIQLNIIISITCNLFNIIRHIERKEWDQARKIFIFDLLKIDNTLIQIDRRNNHYLSLFGDLRIDPFNIYQKFKLIQICSNDCILNGFIYSYDNTNIFFKNDNGIEIVPVESQEITACYSCRSQIRYRIQFINLIKFLFIYSLNNNVYYDLLPLIFFFTIILKYNIHYNYFI